MRYSIGEDDPAFGHGVGVRVRCTVCSVMGPWGGAVGLEGEERAATLWNEPWGRDE